MRAIPWGALALVVMLAPSPPPASAAATPTDSPWPRPDASTVTPPVIGDGVWQEIPPLQRYGLVAVYDSLRDRVLSFGGGASTVWALQFGDAAPLWVQQETIGSGPTAFEHGFAVIDPTRDRMLLYGFPEDSVVWALSLATPMTWSRLSTLSEFCTPPVFDPWEPDQTLAGIYDPIRDRLVVFDGGAITALPLHGTPCWSPVIGSGPRPAWRYLSCVIRDPVRDRLVIYGGAGYPGGSNLFDDAWALPLAGGAWVQLRARQDMQELRRSGAKAVYDPIGDRMIITGGDDPFTEHIWTAPEDLALTLGTSPTLSILVYPGWRASGHATVYDSRRQRIVSLGGWGEPGYRTVPGAISLLPPLPATWQPLMPSDGTPRKRTYASALFDAPRDRFVLYGGLDNPPHAPWGRPLSLGETWSWTPDGWQLVAEAANGATPRDQSAAVLDPIRDRLIVFGGETSDGYLTFYVLLGDLHALEFGGAVPTWTTPTPSGTPPSPRRGHSAVYDPVHDQVIYFGGLTSSAYSNDTWLLHLSPAAAWESLAVAGPLPAARYEHGAVIDPLRRRMIIGGSDTWALALDGARQWTRLSTGGPITHASSGLVYDAAHDRIVSMGEFADSTSILDLAHPELGWRIFHPRDPFTERLLGTAAAFDPLRQRILAFGGELPYAGSNNHFAALQLGEGILDVPRTTPAVAVASLRMTPNPFSEEVSIRLALPTPSALSIEVFDVGGRRLWRTTAGPAEPGTRSFRWDGRDEHGAAVPPGLYLVRAQAGRSIWTGRVVRIR